MKQFLLSVIFAFAFTQVFAQKDVTTFLGIPVDGTKSERMTKLKAKGFVYDSELGVLKGKFNGLDSYIGIQTNNNNVVWRIIVIDANSLSETGIKYRYNNLIDIMNAAGYKTHWLSNQESSGIWGNVAQIYAAHSDVSHYTQIRDSKEDDGRVDGELFPLVDNAIGGADGEKNFYVVHLMGCHLAYYNRYPYLFTKFTEKDITGNYNNDQKEVISQYDNAIFYNDYIVSGIIDKFRETNSDTIVIYLPDHGEAVYDEGGVNGHIEENPSRHMIEVPLIMWASEKFKENHPEKWALIQEAIYNPYMTDDMIHTILDIADIHTPDFDPARSIINQEYNTLRPRFFDEKDYDNEILATGK